MRKEVSMKITKILLLILMLSFVLVACGDDGEGITSKKVNELRLRSVEVADDGSCENYSLIIKYNIKEGIDYDAKIIDLYRGTEIGSWDLDDSGTISWPNWTCNPDVVTWDEELQACRYGIVLAAEDGSETTYRDIAQVGCDPFEWTVKSNNN